MESGPDDPCHPRIVAGTALGDRPDAAISFRRAATAVRRNHVRRRTLVHWELLDRSRFLESRQPIAWAFAQAFRADLHHRTPRSPIEAVIRHGLTKEGLPISTYESLDAAVATHGGVGPVFRHDTNPTATSDRLRELWQAGAHDITLTFSDDTPVPPPPGHSDR